MPDDTKPNPASDKVDPQKVREACGAVAETARYKKLFQTARDPLHTRYRDRHWDTATRADQLMSEADPEVRRADEGTRAALQREKKGGPSGDFHKKIRLYKEKFAEAVRRHCPGLSN